MNTNEILSHIDSLLKESRLDEAEKYMKATLSDAEKSDRPDIMLTLYNELAGFYRDCGRFAEALESCRCSEELLEKMNIGGAQLASALLNSANACRAAGLYDESFDYYRRIYAILENIGAEKPLYASYYNNLALLYQETNNWQEAADCLKKALSLADDDIRRAITRSNLAVCLTKLGDNSAAKETLAPAMETFSGLSPSDFHYSAALAAMGDICFAEKDLSKAAYYYEASLSEIELHMGRNNFYDIVSHNLSEAYENLGGKPALKGMELCRQYFEVFGRPMLQRNFALYLDHIACGLAGEGSECLGFDDHISPDHDFGPSFCIWTDLPDDMCAKIQKAYDLLPKEFMGLKRIVTPNGTDRTGVIKVTDFLRKFTGFDHVPNSSEEWQYTVDENLACAVNGSIFMDNSGFFTDIRQRLQVQPEDIRLRKLAAELEKMAQSGQYNYPRAMKRTDPAAAFFALSAFMESSMKAAHILSQKYAPYSKWLFRSTEALPKFDELAIAVRNIAEGKNITENIEIACAAVRSELKAQQISNSDDYMSVCADDAKHRADIIYTAEEIIAMEWDFFDKVQNEGGRADCQDDYYTFSIMRRSQYYCWELPMLCSLYEDFKAAKADDRNPITEKYGYMMETTAPARFAEIRSSLPEIPQQKKELCSAICQIQTGMMEEFAANYPKLAGRARTIHTYEDTPWLTSYETYLRGELYTYSDITLKLYGSFIARLCTEGKNLAYMIMEQSVKMYGYESLDQAEEHA